MKLKIDGYDYAFECIGIEVRTVETKHEVVTEAFISSPEIATLLLELQHRKEDDQVTAQQMIDLPPAPKKVEYEPTSEMGEHTIKDYLEAGWDHAGLLASGLIRAVEVVQTTSNVLPDKKEPLVQVIDEPPALPELEVTMSSAKTAEIVMTSKANGATLESFQEAGWTNEQLIEHGYAKLQSIEIPVSPAIEEVDPDEPEELEVIAQYPKKVDGKWYDKAGAYFDSDIHGKSNGIPAVKVDGTFKRKRGITDEYYNSKMAAQSKEKAEDAKPDNSPDNDPDLIPDVIQGEAQGDYDDELKRIMANFG